MFSFSLKFHRLNNDSQGPGRWIRMAARHLELHSFSLTPENFVLIEGLRAMVAVAVPLSVAVVSGLSWMGWAVFAAFWTCLCDTPGPHAMQKRLLALFVVFGGVLAFVTSLLASFAPLAGLFIGPVMVFLAVFLSSGGFTCRTPLGTLLAVVVVVAVGFARPAEFAAAQAAAFVGGASWAYILIVYIWRLDELAPLVRSARALAICLADMTSDLMAVGGGAHRDAQWNNEYAQHRRAIRMSMERLRSLLSRYRSEPEATTAPYHRILSASEILFNALIALDHSFIHQLAPADERRAVVRAVSLVLLSLRKAIAQGYLEAPFLRHSLARLARLRMSLSDAVMIGCVLEMCEALKALDVSVTKTMNPGRAEIQGTFWHGDVVPALRQALRLACGVFVIYSTAMISHIGYPYWATMAVVVVLQRSVRLTWSRCLERIVGTLLGGGLALAILSVLKGDIALSCIAIAFGAVSIALRTVNYATFVVFLTSLFIIVTEMLQPGMGIASARMVDNLIGSIAALVSVLVLWPDPGPSLQARTEKGLKANQCYLDCVRGNQSALEIAEKRRLAGLASVDSEITLNDTFGKMFRRKQVTSDGITALVAMRNLAGEAATEWHRAKALSARTAPTNS